ncbi:hypothetical protein KEM52_006019 [Ascosphaera acerosa]|nr:hypothetical protein KEM52_006019 [Ascosphaera acerosa]
MVTEQEIGVLLHPPSRELDAMSAYADIWAESDLAVLRLRARTQPCITGQLQALIMKQLFLAGEDKQVVFRLRRADGVADGRRRRRS